MYLITSSVLVLMVSFVLPDGKIYSEEVQAPHQSSEKAASFNHG